MAVSQLLTTSKQQAFIMAMLTAEDVKAAAKQAHIAETTAHRWLRKPEIRVMMKDAQRVVFERSLARLQYASWDAAAYLHRLVNDEKAADSVRVRAAAHILELASSAQVIEQFTRRIEQLETALQAQQDQYRIA